MTKYYIFLLTFSTICFGDSGAWKPTWTDFYWNNSANWTGATFPNGIHQIAAFIDWPNTDTIDSTEDITIGSLHFDIIGRSVTIGFKDNKLIFDKSDEANNQATIFNSSGQTHYMDTPIQLNSDLAIFVATSSSIHFTKPISGDKSVSFFVDPNTHINFQSANFYTGDTIIYSGNLDLRGPLSDDNIVGNLVVFNRGTVYHDPTTSNNYGPTSAIKLDGGSLDLGGTEQTAVSLEMLKQSAVLGPSGSHLFLSSPNDALTITDKSVISIDDITLAGGAITNGFNTIDAGIIGGAFSPQTFTEIDLSNLLTNINVNNGSSGQSKIDMIFLNTLFRNGTLQKNGNGLLQILGANNQITDLAIMQGQVQFGANNNPAFVDGPSTITVEQYSLLNGFATLGSNANVVVKNNLGIIFPGDLYQPGTLTISGGYEQGPGAGLLIQGQSEASVNTLIVRNGDAKIDGSIFFSTLQGANLNPGDELVLVDAPDGLVTGTFNNFQASLPPGLSAKIIYKPNQVIMKIISCS